MVLEACFALEVDKLQSLCPPLRSRCGRTLEVVIIILRDAVVGGAGSFVVRSITMSYVARWHNPMDMFQKCVATGALALLDDLLVCVALLEVRKIFR